MILLNERSAAGPAAARPNVQANPESSNALRNSSLLRLSQPRSVRRRAVIPFRACISSFVALQLGGLLLFAPVSSSASTVSRFEQPLVFVKAPPPIHMLVPGFTPRDLPLQLNNI